MDIGNIGNKLLSGVEKNATLIGGGVGLLKSYGGLQDSLMQLLSGNIHGPDIAHITYQMSRDASYRQAIAAIIAGYLAQESGIDMVDKVGKITIKAASAFLIVRLAENVLWSCTHSVGAGGGFTAASGSKLIGN